MNITVLVPTHRRPVDLDRCLDALKEQHRPPDQVIVVCRADDLETCDLLQHYPAMGMPIDLVQSHEPGVVAALNAGLRRARGDVLAILDDDTAPWPNWLQLIEQHFRSAPRLGGLGGRDIIRARGVSIDGDTSLVGRVSWYGRWIGQAHRGIGPAREVELLKGCNMSYRREAIAELWFDGRLRGNGAQWFSDSAFSLAVKRAGWRVVYDPAVRVDHYLSPRTAGDGRLTTTPTEAYDVAYNETLVLLEYLSPLHWPFFLVFGFAVGTRRAPGFLQWVRSSFNGDGHSVDFQIAAWRGRLDAWREFRRSRRPTSGKPGLIALER